MAQRVKEHVQAVEKPQRRLLLFRQQFPFRAEPMPAILLLQIVAPRHHTVARLFQTQFLVENREVQRILVPVRARKAPQRKDRIGPLAPGVIVRIDVIAGDERRHAVVDVRERLRLKVGNE